MGTPGGRIVGIDVLQPLGFEIRPNGDVFLGGQKVGEVDANGEPIVTLEVSTADGSQSRTKTFLADSGFTGGVIIDQENYREIYEPTGEVPTTVIKRDAHGGRKEYYQAEGRIRIPGTDRYVNVMIQARKPEGCFITTAVFGSPLHPEVIKLQQMRDNVIRKTRWGDKFFANYFESYNKVSPEIAEKIEEHPDAREAISWSIVRPWLNYLKLVIERPRRWDVEGMSKEMADYASTIRKGIEEWLSKIELPMEFLGMTPKDAAVEIGLVVSYVLRENPWNYLNELGNRGVIPLRLSDANYLEVSQELIRYGCLEEEIKAILSKGE